MSVRIYSGSHRTNAKQRHKRVDRETVGIDSHNIILAAAAPVGFQAYVAGCSPRSQTSTHTATGHCHIAGQCHRRYGKRFCRRCRQKAVFYLVDIYNASAQSDVSVHAVRLHDIFYTARRRQRGTARKP